MNKNNTAIAHQNFPSVQPSVSKITHDILNTLGEVTIPRADKSVITLLLQQQRQRQRKTGAPEDVNANETISSRNEPTAEKVSRGSIATLTPRIWINNKIVNFVGRVLIAPGKICAKQKYTYTQPSS